MFRYTMNLDVSVCVVCVVCVCVCVCVCFKRFSKKFLRFSRNHLSGFRESRFCVG
jgi:hypothetical protein